MVARGGIVDAAPPPLAAASLGRLAVVHVDGVGRERSGGGQRRSMRRRGPSTPLIASWSANALMLIDPEHVARDPSVSECHVWTASGGGVLDFCVAPPSPLSANGGAAGDDDGEGSTCWLLHRESDGTGCTLARLRVWHTLELSEHLCATAIAGTSSTTAADVTTSLRDARLEQLSVGASLALEVAVEMATPSEGVVLLRSSRALQRLLDEEEGGGDGAAAASGERGVVVAARESLRATNAALEVLGGAATVEAAADAIAAIDATQHAVESAMSAAMAAAMAASEAKENCAAARAAAAAAREAAATAALPPPLSEPDAPIEQVVLSAAASATTMVGSFSAVGHSPQMVRRSRAVVVVKRKTGKIKGKEKESSTTGNKSKKKKKKTKSSKRTGGGGADDNAGAVGAGASSAKRAARAAAVVEIGELTPVKTKKKSSRDAAATSSSRASSSSTTSALRRLGSVVKGEVVKSYTSTLLKRAGPTVARERERAVYLSQHTEVVDFVELEGELAKIGRAVRAQADRERAIVLAGSAGGATAALSTDRTADGDVMVSDLEDRGSHVPSSRGSLSLAQLAAAQGGSRLQRRTRGGIHTSRAQHAALVEAEAAEAARVARATSAGGDPNAQLGQPTDRKFDKALNAVGGWLNRLAWNDGTKAEEEVRMLDEAKEEKRKARNDATSGRSSSEPNRYTFFQLHSAFPNAHVVYEAQEDLAALIAAAAAAQLDSDTIARDDDLMGREEEEEEEETADSGTHRAAELSQSQTETMDLLHHRVEVCADRGDLSCLLSLLRPWVDGMSRSAPRVAAQSTAGDGIESGVPRFPSAAVQLVTLYFYLCTSRACSRNSDRGWEMSAAMKFIDRHGGGLLDLHHAAAACNRQLSWGSAVVHAHSLLAKLLDAGLSSNGAESARDGYGHFASPAAGDPLPAILECMSSSGITAAMRALVALAEPAVIASSTALSSIRPSARAVSTALRCLPELLSSAAEAGGESAERTGRFCALAYPHLQPAHVFAVLNLTMMATTKAKAEAATNSEAKERLAFVYLTALMENEGECRHDPDLVLSWIELALASSSGAPPREALYVSDEESSGAVPTPRAGAHLHGGWTHGALVLGVLAAATGTSLSDTFTAQTQQSAEHGKGHEYALDLGKATQLCERLGFWPGLFTLLSATRAATGDAASSTEATAEMPPLTDALKRSVAKAGALAVQLGDASLLGDLLWRFASVSEAIDFPALLDLAASASVAASASDAAAAAAAEALPLPLNPRQVLRALVDGAGSPRAMRALSAAAPDAISGIDLSTLQYAVQVWHATQYWESLSRAMLERVDQHMWAWKPLTIAPQLRSVKELEMGRGSDLARNMASCFLEPSVLTAMLGGELDPEEEDEMLRFGFISSSSSSSTSSTSASAALVGSGGGGGVANDARVFGTCVD